MSYSTLPLTLTAKPNGRASSTDTWDEVVCCALLHKQMQNRPSWNLSKHHLCFTEIAELDLQT